MGDNVIITADVMDDNVAVTADVINGNTISVDMVGGNTIAVNMVAGADITGEVAIGAQGYSAYEVWLRDGNTGSINDFLTSLKGEKGDKGDPGIIQQIIAGDNISVDSTDPSAPIVSSTGIPSEPSIFYDLKDKLISFGGEYITGVLEAGLYYNVVGNRLEGNLSIVVPESAVYPPQLEDFPCTSLAIKGSDLPYLPRLMPSSVLGEFPQTMGFSLMNIAPTISDMSNPALVERYGLGGGISSSGGTFGGGAAFVFFKTSSGMGSLFNLLINDEDGIEFVGKCLIIYANVSYEIDQSMF